MAAHVDIDNSENMSCKAYLRRFFLKDTKIIAKKTGEIVNYPSKIASDYQVILVYKIKIDNCIKSYY